MLPQHGGVPNFSLKIPTPVLILLALVLITGLMLSASLFINADAGDLAARSHAKLLVIITLLLSFLVLLTGTGRWWHPHLWKHGSSRRRHGHHHRRR